jgi:hypothetical protein
VRGCFFIGVLLARVFAAQGAVFEEHGLAFNVVNEPEAKEPDADWPSPGLTLASFLIGWECVRLYGLQQGW